jgi:UDP-N-acetylmuramate--alanine ligase
VSTLSPHQISTLLKGAGRGSTVYLIGMAGCGVSGLAHLLLDAGHRVVGSDLVENIEVRQLRARGAEIYLGHEGQNLRAARPVLVVHSPAVRADNPELQIAQELNLPIVRRAILLAAFVNEQRGICVAGMHGKTTTSALLAHALEKLGAQPSYAIGAMVPQLPAHARYVATKSNDGAAPLFVIEADESDGTLREFRPEHAIILNVDDEHLDHFSGMDAVCREFEQFVVNTRGRVIFCADDTRVVELMSKRTEAVSYGFNSLAQYRAESTVRERSTQFTVWNRGIKLGDFSTRLLGEKNISNAVAVIALLHQIGYQPSAIREAIADFAGAARRQQELFADETVRVFDDYGHHPNEILAVLRAFKDTNPRRLVVVFQPHRYTRTKHLMADFAAAFGDADRLLLTEVYAASEPEIPGANSAALAEAIRAHGQAVDYLPALRDVVPAVRAMLQPGDLILFLGAGDITRAAHELAYQLKQASPSLARPEPTMSASAENQPGDARCSEILAQLRAAVSAETAVRQNEPLAKRTTLRVGGRADFFVEPVSEGDLAAVLKLCSASKLPFTILGRGSNLLIRDGGIRGVVISLGHETFSRVQIVGEHMHCGAGAKLKTVSVEARRAGLAGLEFLEGIPGSVGGALRMNAGAMGAWMFEVVEQIRFMDFSGVAHERKASEVNVEYRGCPLFKTHIALGAVLRGTPSSKEVIQERANQYNAKRWETQPAQPSAGCIFKNPKTVPAGKLIDELGLKGTKRGGAMVSTVHGNFIVNEGNATAKDVLELIDFIKQTAKAQRGIELETEVEILGE